MNPESNSPRKPHPQMIARLEAANAPRWIIDFPTVAKLPKKLREEEFFYLLFNLYQKAVAKARRGILHTSQNQLFEQGNRLRLGYLSDMRRFLDTLMSSGRDCESGISSWINKIFTGDDEALKIFRAEGQG